MDSTTTTMSSTSVTPVTAATSPNASTPTVTTTATTNGPAATTNGTTTTTTTTTNAPTVAAKRPTQSTRSIRIHVNTLDQPRPVIFNYRQLYKRELKKMEELQQVLNPPGSDPIVTAVPPHPMNDLESADDAFYRRLLANAENYNVQDDADDVDDDGGSDEEETMTGKKGGGGAQNEYDFEDPFIDDSEMLMEEPTEYNAPEFDGFFVYYGPLDGSDESEKKSATAKEATAAAPKRKAPSKPKTSTSSTTTSSANKKSTSSTGATSSAHKKDDHSTDESITKKSTASTTTSKPKKQTTITQSLKTTPSSSAATTEPKTKSSTSSTTVHKKTASSSTDQPAKKRKKIDNTSSVVTKSGAGSDETAAVEEKSSGLLSLHSSSGDQQPSSTEKKKKSSASTSSIPHELKRLDPEIEELMEKLRRDVVHEDFENKAKFPLSLKPTVLEAGLIMFRKIKLIDDNLVYHLMTILPYNRFTLKKFVTTKSGQMRVDELQQEIDELAILLKQTIDKMMPEQQRLFNEKLSQAKAELAIRQADPNYKPPVDEDGNPVPELPAPKFKCNDEVRKILYDIIQSEEQSIHIANQVAMHKDSEKKADGLASDNKARKLMYQRLLSCWPEEWMNSYEMSRQYSQYKLKVQADKKTTGSSSQEVSSSSTAAKKRKRVPTPQASPSDETRTKKQSIAETGVVAPPDSFTFVQKVKEAQPVITIDDDDDGDNGSVTPAANNSWKQANSMKIEALISGPNSSSSGSQKKPSSA